MLRAVVVFGSIIKSFEPIATTVIVAVVDLNVVVMLRFLKAAERRRLLLPRPTANKTRRKFDSPIMCALNMCFVVRQAQNFSLWSSFLLAWLLRFQFNQK